jgi:hypothetical protein
MRRDYERLRSDITESFAFLWSVQLSFALPLRQILAPESGAEPRALLRCSADVFGLFVLFLFVVICS